MSPKPLKLLNIVKSPVAPANIILTGDKPPPK